MAFFIGNSFCKLCQKDEEQLENELFYCTNGLINKGYSIIKNTLNSARLPSCDDFYVTYFKNNIWNSDIKVLKVSIKDSCHIHEQPSSGVGVDKDEILLHTKIYQARPDVNAICHTRNPYSIILEDDNFKRVHGEATLILGDIPIIDIENFSDENRTRSLIEKIVKSTIGEPLRPIRTVILSNNSVLALGSCIHEARAFTEILEECARFYIISKIFGGPLNLLTLDQLRALGSRYARAIKFGGRHIMYNANHPDDRINKNF
jgi:ribulose-5-phosphate 4-epimerase/fuculose-1-phosphate aldolase